MLDRSLPRVIAVRRAQGGIGDRRLTVRGVPDTLGICVLGKRNDGPPLRLLLCVLVPVIFEVSNRRFSMDLMGRAGAIRLCDAIQGTGNRNGPSGIRL